MACDLRGSAAWEDLGDLRGRRALGADGLFALPTGAL